MDEIVTEGARHTVAAALEAEVDAHVAAWREHTDERGRLLATNGHAKPHQIATGARPIEV